MEITVKHEFTMSPELESFFKKLYGAVQLPVSEHEKAVAYSKAPDKNKFLDEEIKAEQKLTVEMSAPFMSNETTTATSSKSSVSLEMVRAAVSEKANAGKRNELKELLTSFGSKNVTELDKAKYAEFLNQVNAL